MNESVKFYSRSRFSPLSFLLLKWMERRTADSFFSSYFFLCHAIDFVVPSIGFMHGHHIFFYFPSTCKTTILLFRPMTLTTSPTPCASTTGVPTWRWGRSLGWQSTQTTNPCSSTGETGSGMRSESNGSIASTSKGCLSQKISCTRFYIMDSLR